MACDTKSLATAKVCHWSKHAALFNMSEGQGGQACNTLLCVLRPKSKYSWHRFKCVIMKGVIKKDEIQCRICNNETNDVAMIMIMIMMLPGMSSLLEQELLIEWSSTGEP